jgi:hypothetical protein
LLNLPGDTVSVRYTPGSLDRAVNLQKRVQTLADDFAGWSRQHTLLLLYVLSREEWRESEFEDPFGVPQRMSTSEVAMTAWGDAGTVELWRELLGRRLPVLPGTPMRGSPEEVASLALHDLMAQIEVSRLLLDAAGLRGDRPWVDGVLTHVVALSSYLKHEGERLPEISRAFESLSLRAGGPGARSLRRARQSRILAERLWLEAQFFQAALRLTESEGKAPAKAILKRARKNGGQVEAADLLARTPALGDWLAAAFAPESPGESG